MATRITTFENQAKIEHDKRHGSPYDRGSADKYYGRQFSPHYYRGATGSSERVGKDQMTTEEVAAYTAGYDQETDSKDWGK